MDELTKLQEEIVLITSDIKSIENSPCEDCSYSTFRRIVLRHEETKECQKQVDTLKNMEHNEKIISAILKHLKCDIQTIASIRMISKILVKRGEIRLHELEHKINSDDRPCGETHFTA